MAWYNGGDWEGVSVQALSEILAELCWAINERQAMLPYTETAWTVNSGTTTYPIASDFNGLALVGNPSWLSTNWTAMKNAVITLSGYGGVFFTWRKVDAMTAHVVPDGWNDIADMLTDAGLPTTLPTTLTRVTNLTPFLQIKACLDRMKLPVFQNVSYKGEWTNGSKGWWPYPDSGNWQDTLQDAWNVLLAQSEGDWSSDFVSSPGIHAAYKVHLWSLDPLVYKYIVNADISRWQGWRCYVNKVPGTLTLASGKTYLTCQGNLVTSGPGPYYATRNVDVVINAPIGPDLTLPSTWDMEADGDYEQIEEIDSIAWPTGDTFELYETYLLGSFSTSVPTSWPFDLTNWVYNDVANLSWEAGLYDLIVGTKFEVGTHLTYG